MRQNARLSRVTVRGVALGICRNIPMQWNGTMFLMGTSRSGRAFGKEMLAPDDISSITQNGWTPLRGNRYLYLTRKSAHMHGHYCYTEAGVPAQIRHMRVVKYWFNRDLCHLIQEICRLYPTIEFHCNRGTTNSTLFSFRRRSSSNIPNTTRHPAKTSVSIFYSMQLKRLCTPILTFCLIIASPCAAEVALAVLARYTIHAQLCGAKWVVLSGRDMLWTGENVAKPWKARGVHGYEVLPSAPNTL